jgi:tetratricopeptide (TPR) repeat protein
MITSRNRLTGLIITEGAHALPLDLMTEKEAHDLLLKKLGTARAERDLDAVDDLVQICARLPLALSIVGATARRSKQSLRATADELKQRLVRHDLEAFDTGDPRTNLRTVFSWSYELLPTTTARAFRLLALNPAPDFSAAAAASMMKITLAAARKLILELLNNNLLEEPLASRYRFHDLVRAYAQGLAAELDDEVDVTEAQARLLDFYLRSAHGAVLQMYPLATPITLEAPEDGVLPERPEGYTASLAWFDQEREALPRLVTLAAAQSRPGHAWRLAWTYQDYFRRRGYWREWAATQRAALAAAEAAHDAVGVARSKDGLGRALGWLSEFEEAARQLSLALGAFKALNDLEGQAHVHIDLGTVYELQGYFDLALEQAEESLKIARRTSNRSALAKALNNTGWYYAQLGNPEQALSHCLEALELHRRLQNKRGEFNTLDSIGYAYLNLGDYHAARQHFQQALALHTHIGDRWAHAQTLMHLGDVEEADGNLADAIPKWRDALEIFEQLQHSDAAVARARLARYGPAAAAAPDGN